MDGLQIPLTHAYLFRQAAVLPDPVRSLIVEQETLSVGQAVERMLARFAGERLGMGIPYATFEGMVWGGEASAAGYPFHR